MTEKNKSVQRMRAVGLEPASFLKRSVWWVRRSIFKAVKKDVLNTEKYPTKPTLTIRKIYKSTDDFFTSYFPGGVKQIKKSAAVKQMHDAIDELGYTLVDADETKPWGAFYRFSAQDADRFITEFFPGLDPIEARLGKKDLELSPKFLLIEPGKRLSWQYHDRRAERWRFLNEGAYYHSTSNEPSERVVAPVDTIVQFAKGERHRAAATVDGYTLIAEIWQHTNPDHPSDEADITRLADDYQRTSH